MKHIISKVISWWKSKNIIGKILTVISCIAIVFIFSICGLFVSAYSKDVARQKAKQAAKKAEEEKAAKKKAEEEAKKKAEEENKKNNE